eukprot:TRINITY_DN10960_c0_g1_i1.p1 TRINITY_DN10960_c0_g1~~TRINITY_DN10960_c0_g1_i1.p1  ORF type:complete len:102 (-),score=12.63 TRINITY_DN10960_c0_g1_i1:28-333(-)
MCKGMILDSIKSQTTKQVVYLGDGRGDFCPTLRLSNQDHVLARSGFPLSTLLDACATVKCKVHRWSSADEAAILLAELLTHNNSSSNVDELASKRDDSVQP